MWVMVIHIYAAILCKESFVLLIRVIKPIIIDKFAQ